jgi:hypothetical protein
MTGMTSWSFAVNLALTSVVAGATLPVLAVAGVTVPCVPVPGATIVEVISASRVVWLEPRRRYFSGGM